MLPTNQVAAINSKRHNHPVMAGAAETINAHYKPTAPPKPKAVKPPKLPLATRAAASEYKQMNEAANKRAYTQMKSRAMKKKGV